MKLNIARKVLADVKQIEAEHFRDMLDAFKDFVNADLKKRMERFEPLPKILRYEVHSFKEALPYHDFGIYEVAARLGLKPKFVSDLYCFEIVTSSQNGERTWAMERAISYKDELKGKRETAKSFAINAWKEVNEVLEKGEYKLVRENTKSDNYIISVPNPEPSYLGSYPYANDFTIMAKMAGFNKVEFMPHDIWLHIAGDISKEDAVFPETTEVGEETKIGSQDVFGVISKLTK